MIPDSQWEKKISSKFLSKEPVFLTCTNSTGFPVLKPGPTHCKTSPVPNTKLAAPACSDTEAAMPDVKRPKATNFLVKFGTVFVPKKETPFLDSQMPLEKVF